MEEMEALTQEDMVLAADEVQRNNAPSGAPDTYLVSDPLCSWSAMLWLP